MSDEQAIYGLLAEFEGPDELLRVTRHSYEQGYRKIDCFTPYSVEHLSEAMGQSKTAMPWIFLICGIVGGVSVYALAYWINVIEYPINIGGRPLHSWPSFIPPTFECTILLSAIGGCVGMILLNGLPRLNHPLFEIPRFERASTDAFFICIEAKDDKFDAVISRQMLIENGAKEVWDVPLDS